MELLFFERGNLLSILVTITGICCTYSQSDVNSCNIVSDPTPGKHELPKLHEQFRTGVVATIIEKNYTTEVEEYYDYVNNRASAHSREYSQYYDFEFYQYFTLYNRTCITSALEKNDTMVYFREDDSGHVISPSQWFAMGAEENITYAGTHVVRGIPVDQWSSCVTWKLTNQVIKFKVDYYFNQPDYTSPAGPNLVLPVRLEINGTKKVNGSSSPLHHIYDYVFYRPGPVEDTSVFEIPHGYLCLRNHTEEMPKFSDVFSTEVENINPRHKEVHYFKMVYDYNASLTKVDMVPWKMSHYHKQFGSRELSLIHDYNSGVEYVIDLQRKNCTVQNLPLKQNYDGTVENDTLVRMNHAMNLMYRMADEWHYQGERKLVGIPCDVWTSHVNWHTNNTNHTMRDTTAVIEVFFAKGDWKFGASGQPGDRNLIGTWISHIKNDTVTTIWRSLSLMTSYNKPDVSVFDDIHFCYDTEAQMKHCMFKIEGNFDTLVANKEQALLQSVRNMLAHSCDVEPVRINGIYFATTSKKTIDVWFTILEKPKVKGDAVHQLKQTPLGEAFNNLNEKIKKGVTLTVPYADGQKKLDVLKDSLKTDKDALDPRKPIPINKTGYTSGSMAALGICMLLIGGAIGLGITYFWFKRMNTEVPYVRDEIN